MALPGKMKSVDTREGAFQFFAAQSIMLTQLVPEADENTLKVCTRAMIALGATDTEILTAFGAIAESINDIVDKVRKRGGIR